MSKIMLKSGRSMSKVVPVDEDLIRKLSLPEELPDGEKGVPPRRTSHILNSREKLNSHRTNTKFKQQRLPALRPIIAPHTMFGFFLVFGAMLGTIGGLLYFQTSLTHEMVFDYTNCRNQDNVLCSKTISSDPMKQATNPECVCRIYFTLAEKVEGQYYIFYELTNFYQNHRQYARDVDRMQLNGKIVDRDTSKDAYCRSPYAVEGTDELIWPCGRIANSIFSDKIELSYISDTNPILPKQEVVQLRKEGIAWASDKAANFDNPESPWNNVTKLNYMSPAKRRLSKPISWKVTRWEELGDGGLKDEDLIVWMRIAALPTFRKLYRSIRHEGMFNGGLPKGTYILRIEYSFPVVSFQGTKSVVITTGSEFGGRNRFLAYAYMGLGSFIFLFGIIFSVLFCYEKQHFKTIDNTSNA